MALWSIAGMEDSRERCLAEDVPSLEPIFRFANLNDNMESCTLAGERVRSLAYNKKNYVSTTKARGLCNWLLHCLFTYCTLILTLHSLHTNLLLLYFSENRLCNYM